MRYRYVILNCMNATVEGILEKLESDLQYWGSRGYKLVSSTPGTGASFTVIVMAEVDTPVVEG